ncbi:MAG TPA: hypothetical protein VGH39_13665 [Xanthobacteraceae bacterium]
MSAIVHQIGLVSESRLANMSDLLRVSAAIQKQAVRDLAPIWEISATVDAFAKLEDVPDGYWPMIIKDNIGYRAAGIHLDEDGQPLALINSARDLDTWALTASHEALEMLVDPSGDRQVTGDSPKPEQGRVSFLVEVCDPSEAADFAYTVNGILVSDFYTPHFFDPVAAPGVRYSYTGAITKPREVLRGGYLSWKDPVSGDWWQQTWFDAGAPVFKDIGAQDARSGSARAFVDRITGADTAKALARGRMSARAAGRTAQIGYEASRSNAEMWRKQIAHIVGRAAKQTTTARPAPRRKTRRR